MKPTWARIRSGEVDFSNYFLREKILKLIRNFFTDKGYHDVEVPLLASSPIPESYLEVFQTELLDVNRKPRKAYLTPSPEIFLKKLLVAGIGNCFSLTKSFRNTETFSNTHNPEFTMLEWYRVDVDYKDLMSEIEELFVYIAEKIKGKLNITYQKKFIDLSPPWERLSMVEAFKKYADINLIELMDEESMSVFVKKRGYSVEKSNTWEQLFNQLYLNEVEPKLGRGKPTIIYEFPAVMAALAKKAKDPRFSERFEIFIEGLELGDAYSELSDSSEQESRFKAEVTERKRLGKIDHPYDQDFIEALKMGLPTSAGMAVGVDRLIMLFADAKRIKDTLFFPADEMWTA